MNRKHVILLAVAALVTGCMRGDRDSKVFTEGWAYRTERSSQMDKERAKKKEGYVLAGEDDSPKAALRIDEDGKPKLSWGDNSSLDTNVDMKDGKPSVGFEYKLRW